MHIALVTHGLPQPATNGGPMTTWALLRQLVDDGHRATVVTLAYPDDTFTSDPARQASVRELADLVEVPVEKADLETVPRGAGDTIASAFPMKRIAPRMEEALARIAPDATFVYHWDSLAATHGSRVAPRLAGVDDLWYLPNLRRWQHARPRPTLDYLRWSVRTLRATRPVTLAMADLLNDCADAGAFQAQTAADLRAAGARRCDYLHAPLVDPCPNGVPARPPGGRPRILLGPSQLGATSTAAGIRFFAREVVPRLDRALGRDGYDVHVIGKGDPPDELARMLPHPGIVVRGWVDDIDAELASATLQLAPTPFVLGKRMRIVSAWAYGLCVVAHAAEAVNLPELVDGETGLLGADGAGVADAIVRAARDSDLRERIGTNGRRVYESTFHPSVAARALVQRLEALTSGGVPARSSARGV